DHSNDHLQTPDERRRRMVVQDLAARKGAVGSLSPGNRGGKGRPIFGSPPLRDVLHAGVRAPARPFMNNFRYTCQCHTIAFTFIKSSSAIFVGSAVFAILIPSSVA